MGQKKSKAHLIQWVFNLLTIVPTLLSFISRVVALIEEEAHQAGRGLMKLVLLFLIALTLFLSTWLCLLALLFMYFLSVHLSTTLAMLIILVLNILLLIILGLSLSQTKKAISFPRTRQLIRNLPNINNK